MEGTSRNTAPALDPEQEAEAGVSKAGGSGADCMSTKDSIPSDTEPNSRNNSCGWNPINRPEHAKSAHHGSSSADLSIVDNTEASQQITSTTMPGFPVLEPSAPPAAGLSECSSSQDATMESGTNDSEEDDDDTGGQVSMRNLPDEILDHLLTFVLPYDDMQSCKLVSHRWYHAVKRVEQKLCRLLARSLDELNVAWFHYDTPNLVGSPLPAAAHRVITKRCAHSAAMLDGRMYVFGGCSSRMTSFNDLWWLELGELEWRRPQVVGSYPSPKAYASMVAYGDKLVLFGGWSQAAPYPLHQSWKLFDEMHIYDTKECRWEEVCGVSSTERVVGLPGAPPPLAERWPPKMARHAASVHGHQMVVTGGLHHLHSRHFGATNEVWVYDFVSGEWRHQRCSQPAPPPRYGHSQVALDERHMLLLGGSGGPKQLKQDIWLLELGEPNAVWHWHQLTVNGAERAPSQLWCHPACQVGDKVVVLGRGRGDTDPQSSAAAPPAVAPPALRLDERQAVRIPVPAGSSRGVPVVPVRPAPSDQNRGLASVLDTAASRRRPGQPPPGPETGSLNRRPAPAAEPSGRPSVRPNACCSRERRLAALERMQQRLEAAAAERAAPHPRPRSRRPLTAGYRLVAPAGRRPLVLHVLDVRSAVAERSVTWRQCARQHGPDERILYSLVAARAELVLFGGIVTPPRAAETAADPEPDQNAAFNAVSFLAIPADMFQ
ncbi:F-box only protein 42-like [Amphibalanus amphitrite]|uniref:F-box only protein 42-like n=1 Tax=Amphibalanus amphitrite TaxID=1232801 RepID=UPI001C913206|nr:F-box only protein 42-like [Amphibalanus amphitrite]